MAPFVLLPSQSPDHRLGIGLLYDAHTLTVSSGSRSACYSITRLVTDCWHVLLTATGQDTPLIVCVPVSATRELQIGVLDQGNSWKSDTPRVRPRQATVAKPSPQPVRSRSVDEFEILAAKNRGNQAASQWHTSVIQNYRPRAW